MFQAHRWQRVNLKNAEENYCSPFTGLANGLIEGGRVLQRAQDRGLILWCDAYAAKNGGEGRLHVGSRKAKEPGDEVLGGVLVYLATKRCP